MNVSPAEPKDTTTAAPRLRWKRYDSYSKPERKAMALYRDGIIAAHYMVYDLNVCVSEHESGQFKVSRQFIASNERTAREMCRQLALGTFPAARPPAAEGEGLADG